MITKLTLDARAAYHNTIKHPSIVWPKYHLTTFHCARHSAGIPICLLPHLSRIKWANERSQLPERYFRRQQHAPDCDRTVDIALRRHPVPYGRSQLCLCIRAPLSGQLPATMCSCHKTSPQHIDASEGTITTDAQMWSTTTSTTTKDTIMTREHTNTPTLAVFPLYDLRITVVLARCLLVWLQSGLSKLSSVPGYNVVSTHMLRMLFLQYNCVWNWPETPHNIRGHVFWRDEHE